MIIRPAEDRDLDAILAIYNDAILNSDAIWTEETVDREDRQAWLDEHRRDGHPVLVAEVDGRTVGYACYGPWRSKCGYRHTVENSVYLAEGHRGRGIGRSLMVELIAHGRSAGMHMMVANIDAGNAGSIRLHETLGFVSAGTVREVGMKFGRWLDLAILQLDLSAEA